MRRCRPKGTAIPQLNGGSGGGGDCNGQRRRQGKVPLE